MIGVVATAHAAIKPLPLDQAFRLTATARDNQTIVISWHIAERYYLYRNHMHFSVLKPKDARLGPILKPFGFKKSYPGLGTFEVYNNIVNIPIPIIRSSQPEIILKVSYQGCAEDGFCYPPTDKIIAVNLNGPYGQAVRPLKIDVATNTASATQSPPTESFTQRMKAKLTHALTDGNIFLALFLFFIWGALVSLTPCIYPMIPILSSIIIGQKKPTHARSFALACCYVLGLSITIAVVGLVISTLGYNLQTAMQKPWLIITFSILIVAMALALFGLYNIQLPEFLRKRLAHASDHQRQGSFWSAFVMGVFSMLIVSPCATPPFIFALLVISKSGRIELGLFGLFFMGIGMGLPLLVIGATSNKLLPKSGAWMISIKNAMGVLMLMTAVWMLASVFSASTIMYLWAALAIGLAVFCGAFTSAPTTSKRIGKTVGIVLFVYGIVLTVAAINGQTDPFQPLSFTQRANDHAPAFINVDSLTTLKQELQQPQHRHKPVILDFFAKWCKDCVVMDKTTFANPKVKQRLNNYVLLRADITTNTYQNKQLAKRFGVIAPPALIFFNRNHREIKAARTVGLLSAQALLKHLNHFQLP